MSTVDGSAVGTAHFTRYVPCRWHSNLKICAYHRRVETRRYKMGRRYATSRGLQKHHGTKKTGKTRNLRFFPVHITNSVTPTLNNTDQSCKPCTSKETSLFSTSMNPLPIVYSKRREAPLAVCTELVDLSK